MYRKVESYTSANVIGLVFLDTLYNTNTVLNYDEKHGKYKIKNDSLPENYYNLLTLEEINLYQPYQEYYKGKRKDWEIKENAKREAEEIKIKEYKDIDGFASKATSEVYNKILRILNKNTIYKNKTYRQKDFIKLTLSEGYKPEPKTSVNPNTGVVKTVYFLVNRDDSSFIEINRTLFSYACYLNSH